MLLLVTLLPLLPVLLVLLLPPVLSFIFSTSRATSASIARLSWARTSVISTFSSLLLPLASLLPLSLLPAAAGRLLLLLPEPAAVGFFRAAFREATAAALSAASEAFLLPALLLVLEEPLMGSALGLGAPGTGEGGGVLVGPSLLLLLLPC
jgi:hypothetical protein